MNFSWKRVNYIFVILTFIIGVMFAIISWLPSMLHESFFGDYTMPQFLVIEDNLTLLLGVASAIIVLLTIWNTWQLIKRDQLPRSSGKLQHAVNLVLIFGEAIALSVIFIMTPTNVVSNMWQAAAIPLVLSVVYWAVCALVLKPHKRR